ncbi:MAG: hypothetical protein H8E79_07540 [Desulfobulbaceae bacterium]|uniref:GAF domain-containing protein n=1 Tax=Candidatus Desulfatifera sulfidica TaxID=2841691 RepID=A0A8J6TAL2_9BACT|nr:hypothetical protein [Candidatus Desulfatifera sulfidica]
MWIRNQINTLQGLLFNQPLNRLFQIISIAAIILLAATIVLGIKQHFLYKHCDQMISKSERMLFQFTTLKEHINDTLITHKKLNIKELSIEIEALKEHLDVISDDLLIPADFKMALISEVDLVGLAVALRGLDSNTENSVAMQLSPLSQRLTTLSSRLTHFHKTLTTYTQGLLLGLHKIIIGSLAMVIFLISLLLFIVNRSIAKPIYDLCRNVVFSRRNKQNKTISSTTKPSTSLHELVRDIEQMGTESQRLHALIDGFDLLESLSAQKLSTDELFQEICSILTASNNYCLVWIGELEGQNQIAKPICACGCLSNKTGECLNTLGHLLKYCKQHGNLCESAIKAASNGRQTIIRNSINNLPDNLLANLSLTDGPYSSASFPVTITSDNLILLSLYSQGHDSFQENEVNLLNLFCLRLNSLLTHPKISQETNAHHHLPLISNNSQLEFYRSSLIGSLSQGLNNEMTNLINGGINYTQALMDELPSDPSNRESQELLTKLFNEEQKIAQLIKAMQLVGEEVGQSRNRISTQEIFETMEILFQRRMKVTGIKLILNSPPDVYVSGNVANHLMLVLPALIEQTRLRYQHDQKGSLTKKKIELHTTASDINKTTITLIDQASSPWTTISSGSDQKDVSLLPLLDPSFCNDILSHCGATVELTKDNDFNNICTITITKEIKQ